MAYDQHNDSSEKAGTVAGYNWIEIALNKFVGVLYIGTACSLFNGLGILDGCNAKVAIFY